VLEVLPKRFAKYGLTLHPEKTRLVRFTRERHDDDDSGTFDFLGFTHYWGTSRKGRAVIKRKTAGKRLRRSLKRIAQWCRAHRHDRLREQHRALSSKVRGHYGYYGITGNARWLARYHHAVKRIWQRWLSRRSQRATIGWRRFGQLLKVYPLPKPVVVHSIYRTAKPWTRGAGCGKSARPDLWGSGSLVPWQAGLRGLDESQAHNPPEAYRRAARATRP
jgi:RNA-directed DNA polymerase